MNIIIMGRTIYTFFFPRDRHRSERIRAAQFAHVYGVYAVSLGGGCRRLKSETTMQQGKLARVGDGGGEGGGRDDLFLSQSDLKVQSRGQRSVSAATIANCASLKQIRMHIEQMEWHGEGNGGGCTRPSASRPTLQIIFRTGSF